jgi:hypothetical protein
MGKYDTSMLELRRGSKGARMLRNWSQTTPLKKGWFLICDAPPCWPPSLPIRWSGSQRKLEELAEILFFNLRRKSVPSDQGLGITRENQLIREVQALSPVNDLPVCIGCVLGTERRPANQAFEHNSTNGPPIAKVGISLAVEDFRRNIIRSSNGRVGHGTTGLSPGVDLSTVGYREVNRIIKVTRVAVPVLGSRVFEKVLVVSVVVGLFASGRKTEIGKLDVTTAVKQDVVGFDVTVRLSVFI